MTRPVPLVPPPSSPPATVVHLSKANAAEALSSGDMPAYVDESYGPYGLMPAQQHSVSDLEVPQVIEIDADDDGIDLPSFPRRAASLPGGVATRATPPPLRSRI